MADANRLLAFQTSKKACLRREDLSRKGSIDEFIRPLVEGLNESDYYYTTSTCSGRVSLLEKPKDNAAVKKGGDFILNCHEQLVEGTLVNNFTSYVSDVKAKKRDGRSCLWLKFEPFIMHVQCFNLERAQKLLSVALSAGCRNSGITMDDKGKKILVAIRSTSSMEVPLCSGREFKLGVEYVQFLSSECNRRLAGNLRRLARFQAGVESMLALPEGQQAEVVQ